AGVARPLRARRMVGPFHGLGREREQHGEGKGGGSMHAVFLLVVVGRWRFDATRGPTVATSSATVNPRSCYHPITKRTRDVAAPLAWRDRRAAAYTRGGHHARHGRPGPRVHPGSIHAAAARSHRVPAGFRGALGAALRAGAAPAAAAGPAGHLE